MSLSALSVGSMSSLRLTNSIIRLSNNALSPTQQYTQSAISFYDSGTPGNTSASIIGSIIDPGSLSWSALPSPPPSQLCGIDARAMQSGLILNNTILAGSISGSVNDASSSRYAISCYNAYAPSIVNNILVIPLQPASSFTQSSLAGFYTAGASSTSAAILRNNAFSSESGQGAACVVQTESPLPYILNANEAMASAAFSTAPTGLLDCSLSLPGSGGFISINPSTFADYYSLAPDIDLRIGAGGLNLLASANAGIIDNVIPYAIRPEENARLRNQLQFDMTGYYRTGGGETGWSMGARERPYPDDVVGVVVIE